MKMRRLILCLALLLLPAPAAAAPARMPAPGPALSGAPYLFRDAQHMVRLVFRTDRALARRYDGLIGGGATIAGRDAPLGIVDGRDETTHCYTAAVRFKERIGRRYLAQIAAEPGDPAPFELRIALRRARPGDARGRPLGC
jgi:hypothetical protein